MNHEQSTQSPCLSHLKTLQFVLLLTCFAIDLIRWSMRVVKRKRLISCFDHVLIMWCLLNSLIIVLKRLWVTIALWLFVILWWFLRQCRIINRCYTCFIVLLLVIRVSRATKILGQYMVLRFCLIPLCRCFGYDRVLCFWGQWFLIWRREG